jgi:hypothetical protein
VLRGYAVRTRICQPAALRITGYLAFLHGDSSRAIRLWRHALREAERLTMPLEQAACHLALARATVRGADLHAGAGEALLNQLGASPWRFQLPYESRGSGGEWFFAF